MQWEEGLELSLHKVRFEKWAVYPGEQIVISEKIDLHEFTEANSANIYWFPVLSFHGKDFLGQHHAGLSA